MDPIGFHSILILLGAAVVLVALFRYLRLPQVLAFICAGVLVGPTGMGWIPDLETTRNLAEFGLVFLMFTLGLEFSLPRLVAMKQIVFGLGGAQVLLSCLFFGAAAWWFGVSVEGAIVIGGMLALSSTAIVMKLLIEQLEQNSRHGRHAVSVLLFQDLVVVPFLILIPALGGDARESVWLTLGWVLVKSALVLVAIMLVGRWLLRPLFHEVAAARLREFFMFTVLLLTLTAAWLTQTAGLSFALGAFLAGMMLGETEYRHQVESDILPFRDILLGLFFVTVGMLLDLGAVQRWWPWIAATMAAILVFKTVLITALGKLFRMETGVALRTGLVLSQGGEFGFALLLQANQFRLLDERASQIVLAAVVLSMALAPLLVRHNGWIAKRLVPGYSRARVSGLEVIRAEADAARGCVIICGYGRSGQNLAWMLEQEGAASIALDLDPVRVRDARDAGKPVVYGDATRRDVLEAAGLHRARALVISFNDTAAALKILETARHARPDMPVIVRTMDDADLERLKAAGATEVVPESLEGSLMMGSHMLLLLGVPVSRIVRHVRDVRRDRYRMLRGFFHGADLFEERESAAYQERLHSVSLPEGARAVGKLLSELHLEETGVSVSAVRRGGIRGPMPAPETRLAAGDVLVLYGAPEALEEAEKVLLEG
ncbi:MAG: potassium transporter [Candidatus Muproteobacteria bacterium RIFCSPHIGHO2_01_FULL_65_16]|uniref:Potassium transporter n=2 Tax=Candidatus Muproteobacteria TaxID=1817795 RepID=A0A1F6TIV8_9PROT|nr:MAG: potassium transporter [Candidatus Muproteobacteria bacterium RBG_16_65_31]OGI45109.1 MAG: potassium transporter [Candidatus Muproteobacteria bacterium RIFCSPHIGHO2_01_FULL_65_16]